MDRDEDRARTKVNYILLWRGFKSSLRQRSSEDTGGMANVAASRCYLWAEGTLLLNVAVDLNSCFHYLYSWYEIKAEFRMPFPFHEQS